MSYLEDAALNGRSPSPASQINESAAADLIPTLNNTLQLWECLIMGLLAFDLAMTIYGLGSKMADAILPEAGEVMVVAFTELVALLQLLQILLPVYPAAEFQTLALAQKLRDQTVCRWIGGLFGTQSAEFASSLPKLGQEDLRTFGLFLLPVVAAVVWKWRRLRRRLREIRRQEEAALLARAFGVWEAWRREV